MSVFDVLRLRNFDALRSFLYTLVPVVIVAFGVTNANQWVALAAAVLAPALAAANSVDGFRSWFYALLVPLQAVLITVGAVTENQLALWLPVVAAVIGGGVAASNVHER